MSVMKKSARNGLIRRRVNLVIPLMAEPHSLHISDYKRALPVVTARHTRLAFKGSHG